METLDKNRVEKIPEKIYNRESDNILEKNSDRLAGIVIKLLKQLNYKISVTESCTGGLLSSRIIDIPGASEVFKEGIIAYSNESKISRLKVRKETLNMYGAVSEEVAKEMVLSFDTEVSISTTGIAGPDGGTQYKPVGLVYIGIKIKDEVFILKEVFKGDRKKIREKAVLHALFKLSKILERDVMRSDEYRGENKEK
ncbi:MAG: CinA family protein [Cetobacterium sp.]|uniref:CinA family protein n=1 Tax=unclassified Cetobacterium TaxID=2630983 RepID=UPI00163C1A4C|nr:CinA family protein [Cetobacterium sp. 2A]MBC2856400.1 CinA family protein [Cetobacterium sp. 2A]